ncbi:MAG TPA: efflux transporter outer membrane subunit [Edaphocola sp.]|nr:efflux transporter outer membrane subunit [Edaphocola sp.]
MNKKHSIFIICTGLLLLPLSSCFVAKDYHRPAVSTAHLYRTDRLVDSAALVMDSSSMANVSWKNLFSDTLLKHYISTALDNNIDIRIALQSIDAAAAYAKQGKASYWPSVNAELDYSDSRYSKNSLSGQSTNGKAISQYQVGAGLSWEADIWGKIRSQKRAYDDSYLQTIEAHKAVKTQLVADIASTYYQLMALDEQIRIARISIASRDSSLATTKALKQAGQVTAVAVKQTEAQLYAAQLILLDLQQQRRILENAFCLLLNEPPHGIQRNTLSEQRISTELKVGVPADLLANRPDVRQAELALMQAFEMTNVAKSNFYPSLTITAAGGFQSVALKDWLNVNSIFANIAGSLLQPIINHRQIRTAYEVARSQQQQALLRYEQALLTAGNEVSDALYNYQTQSQYIILEQKQYEAYQIAVNYSEQLLKNGLANYLEVLTARQNALSTQLSLVNARYEQLASIIELYRALGGGWK